MSYHRTRFDGLLRSIGGFLSTSITGPWKSRSLGLISLLLGYYLASHLIVYYLQEIGHRILIAFSMVVVIEFFVRLRNTVKSPMWPLHWIAIDNLRIGALYAVILEAFKLGS